MKSLLNPDDPTAGSPAVFGPSGLDSVWTPPLGFRPACGDGNQYEPVVLPGSDGINLRGATKLALVAVGCAVVLVVAIGLVAVLRPGGGAVEDVADWDRADSMAALFDVEWPGSTTDIHFAKDVWFHYAYEVRVDMEASEAVGFVDAIPDCEPVNEIPAGFINKDWWQVSTAEQWHGCRTDPSVGWSNWVVADLSNADVATVYLAHFQPDT